MCTRHPNLVPFAIPIFHLLILILITIPNLKSADHIGAGMLRAAKKYHGVSSFDYSCTVHVRT